MTKENRWQHAQREQEESAKREWESLPPEAKVADRALGFQEIGLPVAIAAGFVWLIRSALRRRK